jgi:hypothetical protein
MYNSGRFYYFIVDQSNKYSENFEKVQVLKCYKNAGTKCNKIGMHLFSFFFLSKFLSKRALFKMSYLNNLCQT